MEFLPDCFPCALRQTVSAARLVTDDPEFHYRCLVEACKILAGAERGITPPEMGEDIYGMVNRLSGVSDPFEKQKKEQNDVAMRLLPWLRERVRGAEDPLQMAVKLSIAGNVVDPGSQESFNLEESVMDAVADEGGFVNFPRFLDVLKKAEDVLFIADNCGEIVFDRVLIETMLEMKDLDITLAVRSAPIINDVTEKEARQVGLDEFCKILPSGSKMPGTCLEKTNEDFQRAFREADLVISKGQGNWETLEDCDREVFFLFQAKCPVIAGFLGCREGQPFLWVSSGVGR